MAAAAAALTSTASPGRIILWFRNDLRLRDNVIVSEAVRRVQAGDFGEVR
jgi:hypothetical protein